MEKVIAITVGSLVGGFGRVLLTGKLNSLAGTHFPFGTLAVNLMGCLIIGFLYHTAEVRFLLSPNTKLLLMAGLCGAFTTFSTFILDTSTLIDQGQLWKAFLNVGLSISLGILLFRAGYSLANAI